MCPRATLFKREGERYERFEETHYQRTFAIEEYKQWLEDIGFKILEISADFLDEAPTEESERIVFVAQK